MNQREQKITIYRDESGAWRWRWQAANGLVIAASTEGYARKDNAVANLIAVSGGLLDISFSARIPPPRSSLFQQGVLIRTTAYNDEQRIFVQVIP